MDLTIFFSWDLLGRGEVSGIFKYGPTVRWSFFSTPETLISYYRDEFLSIANGWFSIGSFCSRGSSRRELPLGFESS